MKSPTLADVAGVAGVSKATASRALDPRTRALVLPETELRVRQAAEQLGFVMNRIARGLARGRTGLVAAIVPTLDNSFFLPILAGAQKEIGQADLQLTVSVTPMNTANALGRLVAQVDGVLLLAPQGSDDEIRAIAAQRPVVLIDREIEGVSSIIAHTAPAFAEVVRGLAERGHRRIVHIGGPDGSWQNEQRIAVIREAADAAGVSVTLIGPVPPTFGAGVEAAAAVINTDATAVVPYSTSVSLGVMFGLREHGLRVPQDVLVSSERLVADVFRVPGTPAIDVDGEDMGRQAATLLLGQLGASPSLVSRVRLPVSLTWS